jgi:protein-tyrosine phosphatase
VLYRLTESDTVALGALGIRTVIDLRSTYEVLHYPQTSLQVAGLQHVNVPIWSETYSATGSIPEDYLILLHNAGPGFREIFGHLANDPYPLIINCFAGKDRTGLTTALILGALGVPDHVIVADYVLSGQHMFRHMHIHGTTDEAMVGRGHLPPWLEATPEMMETTLQAITTEWGSVSGYLASIGVPAAELRQVSAALIESPGPVLHS